MSQALKGFGLIWTPGSINVAIRTTEGTYTIRFPVPAINAVLDQELSAVGCRMPPGVGETGVGLFGGIKRLARRATRPIRRRVRRAVRRATRRVRRAARSAYRASRWGARQGLRVGRSRAFRAGLGAAAIAVPALAPAAAAVEAANRIYDSYQRGGRAAQLATGVLSRVVGSSRRGDPRAAQIVGAMRQMRGRGRQQPRWGRW